MSDAKYHRPAWVNALTDTGLSSIERVVLAYLVWRQGRNGSAWPSQRIIAEDLGLTCEGVRKITQRLQAKGRLNVTWPGPGRGRHHRKRYHVTTSAKTPMVVQDLEVENPNNDLAFAKAENPNSGLQKTPTAKPPYIGRTQKGTQKSKGLAHTKLCHKRFIPPTPREVEGYAEVLGYTNFHDGEAFVAYYAERGWRDSKGQAVRDWKAKLRAVWLKDLKKPQRGDYEWLPTEQELDAILAEAEVPAGGLA